MTALYDGPIIDPHHHLWDLSLDRHPWLQKPEAHATAAPALCRDYGVDDYAADARNQNIVATVHIEAGWSADHPGEELRWLDGLPKPNGIARRYVAHIALDDREADRLLATAASNERVVGVRDIVSWHADGNKSFARAKDLMDDPAWRRGLTVLTGLGLSFDLMLYPWQMAQAARLVADFSETVFILNHCGSPIDRTREGMALWRGGLARLGLAENVLLKISDPVAYDNDWTLTSLREVILHCLDCFGPGRSMFASDFPVAGLHASFDDLYGSFKTITADLSADEKGALFFGTANRCYRLGVAGTE